MQALLDKLTAEKLNDAANFAHRLQEEWADALELGSSDLLERYRAFKLGLHVHFRVWHGDFADFCAVFHDSPQPHGVETHGQSSLAGALRDSDMICVNETDGDDSVLVGVVYIAQHPQGVFVCGSPSMVRLQTLNDCIGGDGHSLYHGWRSGFVSVRSLKDGELRLGVGGLLSQLKDGVIEGRAQLISTFASEQREVQKWHSDIIGDGKISDYTTFKVFLGPQRISNILNPGGVRAELVEVLFGPFNLGSDSI